MRREEVRLTGRGSSLLSAGGRRGARLAARVPLRRDRRQRSRTARLRGALLAAGVLVHAAAPHAGAQEGLYVGVAAGWDRASADYTKSVRIDVPPASHETATNDAQAGFGALRASLGYRGYVAGRVYVAGEFEAAFHGGDGAAGYLQEGTGVSARDVWPGPWSVRKHRAFGANARLGYAPGGLLGEGGSVYFVTGVHWLRATLGRGSDVGGRSRRVAADHTLRPWIAGAGVEWGNRANRIAAELRYAAADLAFRTGGDGSAIGSPRIDHTLGLREWSVQVGYTRSF